LLCKCGSADSISTLIKESLEAELAKVASTKADSDDDKEEKGKRKRNRRKTGSSVSSSSASKDSEGAVFPYPLTLKILNSISSGSDSLCNQARLSIIQNDDAVEILLSTFNLLKKTMFDVCLTNNVIGYSSLQINMFIESIELFGRLLTHINVEESINKKKNDQDDVESKHQETCLSDDMKDLIQWAFNDLLPLTINNEEDDDVEEEKSSSSSSAPLSPVSGNKKKKKKGKSKKVSDDILSPPMKAPRANGTSPVSNNAALAIAASSSSSSSMNNFVASNVACEIVAIVLSLASDWTACGMSLNFLSSAAEQCAMFLINISDMHKDDLNNGNDVNFNENMGGILSALGRFTYQLAVQETQGASCPPSALSLLLRSAHLELSSPTTSSSTSTSSSFNMLRHDNDNQEIVHGYVLQLLTLATRRGHDTLNRLVLYFIDTIIEHSMIEIPKDEEIDLDGLATSCLTASGQVIVSIVLKHKNG
jgi:hypothetical protein